MLNQCGRENVRRIYFAAKIADGKTRIQKQKLRSRKTKKAKILLAVTFLGDFVLALSQKVNKLRNQKKQSRSQKELAITDDVAVTG